MSTDVAAMVAWLREQVDEDERVALHVKSSWRLVGDTGVIVASDGTHAEECAAGYWSGIGEHIVCHDPQRALDEVAAKRQILRELEEAEVALGVLHAGSGTPPHDLMTGAVNSLRRVARQMAFIYRDRPGCLPGVAAGAGGRLTPGATKAPRLAVSQAGRRCSSGVVRRRGGTPSSSRAPECRARRRT